MSWAAEEFREIDLGDERLDKRAMVLMDKLSARPTASIPGACGGWAETQAAYRFLSNDGVTWEGILTPHWQCSRERMAGQPVVLCLQDTTELDFNGQTTSGLGPLSYEAQRGMYVHPTYAVSVDREPLGVLDAWMWARQPKDAEGLRDGITESTRWIEGYERVAEMAADLPSTRLVYVADRESDMIDLMARATELGNPADWLLRAQHNRHLPDGDKLWPTVMSGKPLCEMRFIMPSRQGQKAREVCQHLWARTVELPHGRCGTIRATFIVAKEMNPPAGTDPVVWRLLTNRQAETPEAVAELIDWYRARWEIELFFHVLKNGCKVEALQLGAFEGLQRALALYMITSWRVARLMRLGRTCPELDAELMFDRDEWQAAYILNKKKPPANAPRLNEVIRLIAKLGGFLARKGDREPGVKTIWIGLQRVMDFAIAVKFLRAVEAGNCV
jgi:hypothetical protein